MKVGFLHIGKTGGNSLRPLLTARAKTAGLDFTWFGHDVTLRQALQQDPDLKIGFVFRDPAERFISAFWSRLRMGRPRNNSMWSPEEAVAFQWFATPSELAEALGSTDERMRSAALFAMNAISHLRRNMAWSLGSPSALEKSSDRLVAVTPLEQLDQRLPALMRSLGMQPHAEDTVAEHLHVRPGGRSSADELTATGLTALKEFWSEDFALYDYCLARYGGEAGAGLRQSADAAAAEALEHYRAGSFETALPLCARALVIRPVDRTMRLIRARALTQLEDTERGALAWQDVLEIDPNNAEALISLARISHRTRDLDAAAAWLERGAAAAPEDQAIRRLRLIIAENRGDTELIRQIIDFERRELGELASSDDWIYAARMLIVEQDITAAEQLCNLRRTEHPDDADLRLVLARLRLQSERILELEELIDEADAAADSLLLLGLIRAARARKDPATAALRLALLEKNHPGSAAIPHENKKAEQLHAAIEARDTAAEKDVHITALLGVSFCGSTALGSMLGSLPGVSHVGESHRLINSTVMDEFGQANTPYDFDNDDPSHLTGCHRCGADCEMFSRDFRRDLQENPENWFFRLASTAGVAHLVTGDKYMVPELDPLERYDAVVLFKHPDSAFRSNLKRRLAGSGKPGHFDDPVLYGDVYALDYRRYLHAANPEGKKIFLNWNRFTAEPERHLKRLCELLGLPFDTAVLSRRDPDQHAFGGNQDVRDGFRSTPAEFSVRSEHDIKLSEEQLQALRNHAPMQSIHEEMMALYRRAFD